MANKKKNFESLDSLKNVERVINEVDEAQKDKNRTGVQSAIPEALAGAGGAAVGGAASFAALFFGGSVTGLSAAGITSGLAAAGAIIGGGMVAGVFVLAAPVAVLGVGGYAIVRKHNENKLAQERQRLYNLALQKHQAIIEELKKDVNITKDRADYLNRLNILLTQAIKELKSDLEQ